MARTPYATDIYDTPQKSIRIPSGAVGYVVIHHTAGGTYEGIIALEMGARQVSSTVIIEGVRCASMMDEFYRAWSLSSQYWDSVSLSSETVNSGGAEEGWPISEASYRTLAKIVADWCIRYGIPCNRTFIMGHREVYSRYGASYATACPGGIDLDRVVADANQLLNPTTKELPMRTTQFIQMGDAADWSRVGADVLPVGNFPGGYEATSDINVARLWDAAINGNRGPVKLAREAYIAQQQLGKREYDLHRADDIARIREALSGSAPGGNGGLTIAQETKLMSIPTAEQNGAAARAAIVK